jgi:hypothetical protein
MITSCWMKLSKIRSTEFLIPVVIGFSAYAFFIRFQGFWPTDVSWMLPQWNGNIDSASHYIGWEIYRQSDLLQWPIGRSPMLGPDGGSSIAYSTLPLLALIFKPFTHWSNTPLQFFGFWSLVCFIGQSVSSWKLLGLWISNRIYLTLGVCFFVISPAFLDRLSVHFDASAHFLMIFALYLYFDTTFSLRRWLILGTLSVFIFPYIAMMVSIIFVAHLISEVNHTKQFFVAIKRITIYIGLLVLAAWQCGYFILGGSRIDAEGYGIFSANGFTFVDPGFPDNYRIPWSHLVPDWSQGSGQYEGFAFLGGGVLLLATIAWFLKVVKGNRSTRAVLVAPVIVIPALFGRFHELAQFKLAVLLGVLVAIALENVMQHRSNNFASKVVLSIFAIGMFVFALSHRILFGQFEVAYFDLDPSLLKLANTFRSSGRFAWPLMIIFFALIIIQIIRELPRSFVTPVLVATLVFQVGDSNNGWQFTTNAYSRTGPEIYLTSETWNLLGDKYDGVLFSPATHKPRLFLSLNQDFISENGVLWRDIGVLAQKYGWSMNSSYFSRDPGRRFDADNEALNTSLNSGSFRKDMLYIFDGSDEWERAKLVAGPNDLVGILNGVPIFAPDFYPCEKCIYDGFIDRHVNAEIG